MSRLAAALAAGLATWVGAGLGRRLLLALGAGLVLASVVFLAIFVGLYQQRLLSERGQASNQVNHLLQVALENAMLKHDLDGLREIVQRLGDQDRITRVMIVDPDGEVRFASEPEWLGQPFDFTTATLCADCPRVAPQPESATAFMPDELGTEVLRSINPVANREPCTECHGGLDQNPINGVLVVDYDAGGIKQEALSSALIFGGSGILVVIAALAGTWIGLRRFVLQPVQTLTRAAQALADGDLSARTGSHGADELGLLAHTFDHMAKRLEDSLRQVREREAFGQAVIDAVPDGIRVIDQDFTVLEANRAYCQQLGLTMAEVVGRPCYTSSHQRDEPCPATLVTCPLQALGSNAAPLTCRHRHLPAGGGELFVEVSAARLDLEIDGRKRALVVEAIRDLGQEMKLSQEQKLSEIGLLATGVAHEVRNPMASIQLSLGALRRGFATGHGDEAAHYLTIIGEEIQKCLDVTDRLLKLSVPASERPALVALDIVVPEVMSLLSFEAERTGVAVELKLADALRVIASDSEMRMVVLNLSQNAFHAMPEGGRLVIAGGLEDGQVWLAFEDTGIGIPVDDMARIFDPFWSRRADGVAGTGLGLSICRAILRRWQGTIEVQSELGHGTRIQVRLPHADAESQAA